MLDCHIRPRCRVTSAVVSPLMRESATSAGSTSSTHSRSRDPAFPHDRAGRVVFRLGSLHPQHVVDEQLFGVRRGQPGVPQAGRCTITSRSLPTSECTPSDMATTSPDGFQAPAPRR